MTFRRAGLLAAGLVLAGVLAGWALVRLPRAIQAPPGQADRLDDIKKRLPPALTPDAGPRPGSVIPPFVRGDLGLTGTQHQKLADLERVTTEKLSDILTPEQMRKFGELLRRGPERPKFIE